MKTAKEHHENLRKELWIKAWVAVAGASNSVHSDSATKWADAALKEFDSRFKKPEEPTGYTHPLVD